MHVISVQGSKTQKSKLRNGHKVRVKHGAGFNVIVSPSTYHIVSRAFSKNKGISLQLSPEELEMNRAPSPEMQQAIMGHKEHMIIPGVTDHINVGGRGLGTGIGDWFKNLGNKIKGGFEQHIINPIKENIVDPAKDLYEKHVPEEYRRDINTAMKFGSPVGLLASTAMRLKRGDKIQDIGKDYFEDLKHLNATKNKIIKSNPALTEAYKKGVMATAGVGSAALGTALGLNPATGALLGAAGTKGAEELLKAEGYGLHHAIDHGLKRASKAIMKHFSPIEGGSLGRGHVMDFFKHAGNKVKNIVKATAPMVKAGAKQLHEFVLKNPKLGEKIKEHGSKLAGLLAKEGIKYMGGSDEMAELGSKLGKEAGERGFKHIGYGEEIPKAEPKPTVPKTTPKPILESQYPPMPYHYDKPKSTPDKTVPVYKSTLPQENLPLQQTMSPLEIYRQELRAKRKAEKGRGLYASKQGRGSPGGWGEYRAPKNVQRPSGAPPPPPPAPRYGKGIEPPSRLVGGGVYKSFESLHNANMGYSDAIARLSRMQDKTVAGQHESDPIKRYWDEEGQPPSRGYGLHKNHHGKVHHRRKRGFEGHNHYNLIQGRGTLIEHSHLPPALQSQPYGSNFHMQFMLPPQYQKYNDGTNEY